MTEKLSGKMNHSMLVDFYELTMAQAYFQHGKHEQIAYFDLFFRTPPQSGGYAVMAGVEQVVSYLKTLSFDENDIEYLRSQKCFSEDFLDYLRNMKFSCDVWAIPEGCPIFPKEPILKVRGPIIQAILIETMLLLSINHQSLIATKAARIMRAAEGRTVMEFGARRAQGADASLYGARAAYIVGVDGSSCTLAGRCFDIPVSGTMAHAFIQSFPSEYEAFKAYAEVFPDATLLLVDTFNTLESGVPNAIRVAKEILEPQGKRLKGIRIDSGDLSYLSIEARKLLDAAGLHDAVIVASNSLDEYIIGDLLRQGAKIDVFGVGERLITSRAEPVFGGVYKLAAIETDQGLEPKMKISNNEGKVTNPGNKVLYRFYDKKTKKAMADLIALEGDVIPEHGPFEIFDPVQTWKRKTLNNYDLRSLLEPIFVGGVSVYKEKTMDELRKSCEEELETLWDSIKRFDNPQSYYVDLSESLWRMKNDFLHAFSEQSL